MTPSSRTAPSTSVRKPRGSTAWIRGLHNRFPRSGRFGRYVLRLTRGGVAWGAVGCMMAAYELALGYATEREQSGRPIAGFQLVQDHLATMLGNLTSVLALVVRLAQLQDAGVDRDEHSALASR